MGGHQLCSGIVTPVVSLIPHCRHSDSALRTIGCVPTTMQWHSDARTVPDSALRNNGYIPTTMQWHSAARSVSRSALRTNGYTPTTMWRHSETSQHPLCSGIVTPVVSLNPHCRHSDSALRTSWWTPTISASVLGCFSKSAPPVLVSIVRIADR